VFFITGLFGIFLNVDRNFITYIIVVIDAINVAVDGTDVC